MNLNLVVLVNVSKNVVARDRTAALGEEIVGYVVLVDGNGLSFVKAFSDDKQLFLKYFFFSLDKRNEPAPAPALL